MIGLEKRKCWYFCNLIFGISESYILVLCIMEICCLGETTIQHFTIYLILKNIQVDDHLSQAVLDIFLTLNKPIVWTYQVKDNTIMRHCNKIYSPILHC